MSGTGEVTPGATNTLVDVAGLSVGHAQHVGDGWLSGTTVVLCGPDGAVGGVDVRGGGPGTRETDLLDPRNAVERVHAVVLTGGSAFGLAAATGVVSRLLDAGVGFPVGPAGHVVPIVPGAVIFDLGRGGDFRATPEAGLGAAAFDEAVASQGAPPELGSVGAGTGAVAGGLKGGVGSASAVLPDGTTVAALIVVNAAGSTVDPRTGELLGLRFGLPGEFDGLLPPEREELGALFPPLRGLAAAAGEDAPVLATTIGVLATDASLTKAQCAKLAGIGHDGMARAISPVHTMFDGDTIFALSTTRLPAPDPWAFHGLLEAGAHCVSRAVVTAMLRARGVATPAGRWLSYEEAAPSALGGAGRQNDHVRQ